MQKIKACLWFDTQAEEAVNFYVSLFKDSNIKTVSRYDEATAKAAKMPVGTVLVIDFELNGVDFMALNGGPAFKFTEAISLMVNCKDQEEIDHFWYKLSGNGGQESMCGWLKDKYGLSWQIIPEKLGELMKKNAPKVMEAVMQMKKLDIAAMEKAAEG